MTGRKIAAGAPPFCIDFSPEPQRIYIADKRLKDSIEKGVAPGAGNPNFDGAVMWSFVEYLWEPTLSRYTFDLSYIDVYSYPITVTFSNVPGDYDHAVEGHEYGPKKVRRLENDHYLLTTWLTNIMLPIQMSSIRAALEQQTDSHWKNLTWSLDGSSSPWFQWPGMYRGESLCAFIFARPF